MLIIISFEFSLSTDLTGKILINGAHLETLFYRCSSDASFSAFSLICFDASQDKTYAWSIGITCAVRIATDNIVHLNQTIRITDFFHLSFHFFFSRSRFVRARKCLIAAVAARHLNWVLHFGCRSVLHFGSTISFHLFLKGTYLPGLGILITGGKDELKIDSNPLTDNDVLIRNKEAHES